MNAFEKKIISDIEFMSDVSLGTEDWLLPKAVFKAAMHAARLEVDYADSDEQGEWPLSTEELLLAHHEHAGLLTEWIEALVVERDRVAEQYRKVQQAV